MINNNSLPTISSKALAKIIRQKPNENYTVLKKIENIFLKERGYVFNMPKKNKSVVLMLSGGMDSVALWAILMSVYKINVYPIYFPRKRNSLFNIDNMIGSVNYFAKLFSKKYPDYYNEPYISTDVPSNSNILMKKTITEARNNPDFLFSKMNKDGDIFIEPYGAMVNYSLKTFDYTQYLHAKFNIKIDTILCAVLGDDGDFVKGQTLTSLRSVMLTLCIVNNNYNMQFSSPYYEPCLNTFITKNEVMMWASKNKIPLGKSWSCQESTLMQCGTCISCFPRKDKFKKYKIIDNEWYQSDFTFHLNKLINKLSFLK
jgi:hypothetical protein